jgi:hypothetical protein
MVFTNVYNPRSAVVRKDECAPRWSRKARPRRELHHRLRHHHRRACVRRRRRRGQRSVKPCADRQRAGAPGRLDERARARLDLPLSGDGRPAVPRHRRRYVMKRTATSAGGTLSIKIVTIVGGAAQFIKAAAVSRVIRNDAAGGARNHRAYGPALRRQHVAGIFRRLEIPAPDHSLGVSGGSHGEMTGRMLEGVERVLVSERPDWVLVYGDTNSTLAEARWRRGDLHIPVAHVEAGLRSFSRRMPEGSTASSRIACRRCCFARPRRRFSTYGTRITEACTHAAT